jgi:lysophospholipase L1-like esterase
MLTALVSGGLLTLCSFIVKAKPQIANAALLIFSVAIIVMVDRALLAYWGLPHWIPDTQLHYRHRPSTIRINIAHNTRAQGKRIEINQHGFHDDEFPVEKEVGEVRILFLGDSVTMGWGIEHHDTYANQMETFLRRSGSRIQCINAGVEGYATYQELQMLRECLHFVPDRVVLGFVMNDVVGPGEQDHRHEGSGLFWGLTQNDNALLAYFSNETGLGRTLQKIRQKQHEQMNKQEVDFSQNAFFTTSLSDSPFTDMWQKSLEQILQIQALCLSHRIPFTLVVFPETFQLFRPERQQPQKILHDFAEKHSVEMIDLTLTFEQLLSPIIKSRVSSYGPPVDLRTFQDMADVMATVFFLDDVHLSAEGHRVIGISLAKMFGEMGLGPDSAVLMPILQQAAAMKLEPIVVIPKNLELVWRRGKALVEMGYDESACELYEASLERFTSNASEIRTKLQQEKCYSSP